MLRTLLGHSGLDVPVFAVGTGVMGAVPRDEGVRILLRAHELGAVWWDTSDDYGTHPTVGEALARVPRAEMTVSTKIHARQRNEARMAVKESLRELGVDYLDMMFLHYVKDAEDFASRRGCLQELKGLKARGVIRAIGLSSHSVDPIMLASGEEAIDVIFAPWNVYGRLPGDGSVREMEAAIRACYAAGKGVVLMKLLAGGALRPLLDTAIRAGVRFPEKHALNIGVTSVLELETDIRLVLGQPVDASVLRALKEGHSDGRKAA